jgi:hypothetical protein
MTEGSGPVVVSSVAVVVVAMIVLRIKR